MISDHAVTVDALFLRNAWITATPLETTSPAGLFLFFPFSYSVMSNATSVYIYLQSALLHIDRFTLVSILIHECT